MLTGIARTYADGERLFAEGDAGADMYVVLSGGVRLTREDGGGEQLVATLGPGDFFGELAVFNPGPRTATATADGETQVEVIDRVTFLSEVRDPLLRRMLNRMSERLAAGTG